MTTSDTPPGSPSETVPDSPSIIESESPNKTPTGSPLKEAQDSPRVTPSQSPYYPVPDSSFKEPPGSPRLNPSKSPCYTPPGSPSQALDEDSPDSPTTVTGQVETMPDSVPIDEGPQSDGSLKIHFDICRDDGSKFPVQGVVALALNEAARKIGIGMVYHCPSCYPQHPNVPELFYHNSIWTDMDRENWDAASHQERLQMCTQVRVELDVLPLRVLVFDEPQSKIQFSPEDCRLSSVVLMYDHRPYIDWYRNYASRRDDTRGIITINLAKHMPWFRSIRCADNTHIITLLEQWYRRPIEYGLKNYGKTVDRIMECEDQRRGYSIEVFHSKRRTSTEGSDDDTSSEESDDGEPEQITPLPLRTASDAPATMSDEGFPEAEDTTPN